MANGPFDTLSLMGWNADTGRSFARTIENHGFARDYTTTVDGRTRTLSGEHERATHRFSEDGRTQEISWQWKTPDQWLPLCDRTRHRLTLPNAVVLAHRHGAETLGAKTSAGCATDVPGQPA